MNPELWRIAGQVESSLRNIAFAARNGYHAAPDIEAMKQTFSLIERFAQEALPQAREITEAIIEEDLLPGNKA